MALEECFATPAKADLAVERVGFVAIPAGVARREVFDEVAVCGAAATNVNPCP